MTKRRVLCLSQESVDEYEGQHRRKSRAQSKHTHTTTECVSEFLLIFVWCVCPVYGVYCTGTKHAWLFGMASRSAIIQLNLIFGHFLCPLLDISILNGGPQSSRSHCSLSHIIALRTNAMYYIYAFLYHFGFALTLFFTLWYYGLACLSKRKDRLMFLSHAMHCLRFFTFCQKDIFERFMPISHSQFQRKIQSSLFLLEEAHIRTHTFEANYDKQKSFFLVYMEFRFNARNDSIAFHFD